MKGTSLTLTVDRSEPTEGLGVFRFPRSVTVVGASADPAKWGHWLARGAIAGAHRRPVYLVNRHRARIEGHVSVSSLAEIDGELDLVVLCTPAVTVPDVVEQAIARGARGFIGITAGLDRALARPGAESALVETIRAAGARIVGPNCLGLFDAEAELHLAWGDFEPGALAIVSQSGQVGSEIANLAAERGVGVSRFVSVGNQADVGAEEILADLVHDARTRVVTLYAESFTNGRSMVETLRRLRSAGKPVVLLAVGASGAGRSAAQSHTGALTSPFDVVDAACRAAGAIRVETPAQLVDTAHLLVNGARPRGDRVAIFGDSGGQGAIAADLMTKQGLRVGALDGVVRDRVAALVPPHAGLHNPIDLSGAGERDLGVYADVAEVLLADDGIDAVTVTGYFGSYGLHIPSLQDEESAVARRIAQASSRYDKPVVVHSMCRSSSTLDLLDDLGVPTYYDVDAAATSLGAAARLTAESGRALAHVAPRPDEAVTGYLGARRLLARAGITFPAARRITSADQVAPAAAELTPPYVLKADWVVHKTEAGAVIVGLGDAADASRAFGDMVDRIGPGAYVLEEMDTRADCVEMVIGAHWDPAFGATVTVGAGGIDAEVLEDTAVELAPVDPDTAAAMVRRLRSYRLLGGWRARPAVDVDELTRSVVALSRLIAARPDCAAIEVNPLRVGSGGVRAVDALVLPLDPAATVGPTFLPRSR